MKLCYEYMVIFFNFSPSSSHRHPLQVENCDSNSRHIVDEDDNGKFRAQKVKWGSHNKRLFHSCNETSEIPRRVVLSVAVDWCICFTRKIQHCGDWERSRPQDPKNVHNFLMTLRPLTWACGHGTEMLLIIMIIARYIQIWQSQEMSHDFVRGKSVAETCFSP